MKNLFGILCAACGILMMPACTDEMDTGLTGSYEYDELGMTEVSLNLGGDFIDVYDTPLTRADGQEKKKLYAVNVYYDTLGVDKPKYNPYAFGLFDDVKKMKIKLSDNYQYKFECTVVREDMEELQTWWTSYSKGGVFYSYPFMKIDNFVSTMETASYDKPGATEAENQAKIDAKNKAIKEQIEPTSIMNKFQYSYVYNLSGITNGKAYVKCIDNWTYKERYWKWESKVKRGYPSSYGWLKKEAYSKKLFSMKDVIGEDPNATKDTLLYCSKERPAIDRWYGELEKYVVNQGNATIDLRRTAFGLKLIVKTPADGTVTVTSDLFNIEVKASDNGYKANKVYESIFSFSDVKKRWEACKDDPSKLVTDEIDFTITHERGDGSINKKYKKVVVKRNRLTTVFFDSSENMSDSSFTISEDESIEPDTTIIVK